MTAFSDTQRPHHLPALTGTLLFHALLLSIVLVTLTSASETETVYSQANPIASVYFDVSRLSSPSIDQPAAASRPSAALMAVVAPANVVNAAVSAPPTTTQEVEQTVPLESGRSTDVAVAPVVAAPAPDHLSGQGVGQAVGVSTSGAAYDPLATNEALTMPGWRWLAEPRPLDRSTATGTLVFEVRVDESGAVTSIQKLAARSTFTDPIAERAYMDAIEKTEFEQIATTGTQRGAVGHITFRIGAK